MQQPAFTVRRAHHLAIVNADAYRTGAFCDYIGALRWDWCVHSGPADSHSIDAPYLMPAGGMEEFCGPAVLITLREY